METTQEHQQEHTQEEQPQQTQEQTHEQTQEQQQQEQAQEQTQEQAQEPQQQEPQPQESQQQEPQQQSENPEPTAEQLLKESENKAEEGDELADAGKYTEAISAYSDAAKILASNKFKPGTEEFRKMLNQKNNLFNEISTLFIRQQNFREASSFCQKVLNTDAENLEALVKLGLCEEQLGNVHAAYNALVKILQYYNNRGQPAPEETVQLWKRLKSKIEAQQPQQSQQTKQPVTEEQDFFTKYPVLRQAFLFVPSSVLAAFAVKYVTKEDLKKPKALASSVVLAGFFLGVFSDKSYKWKGVFGLFAAGFLGFLYKYSRK